MQSEKSKPYFVGQTQKRAFFEKLVNDYGSLLYAQIRSMVLSHDDADDVLQNTFIKAWNNLESFNGEAAVSTWLYRIAANEALQHLRRTKWRRLLHLKAGKTPAVENTSLSPEKTSEKLLQAMKLLTAHQRAIFGMRYFNETPYSEIAQTLKISENTAKATYHQSVKKIEKFLTQIAE
jgi:RNA polymerase sigma-70 factor, ECF subfamily